MRLPSLRRVVEPALWLRIVYGGLFSCSVCLFPRSVWLFYNLCLHCGHLITLVCYLRTACVSSQQCAISVLSVSHHSGVRSLHREHLITLVCCLSTVACYPIIVACYSATVTDWSIDFHTLCTRIRFRFSSSYKGLPLAGKGGLATPCAPTNHP